MGDQSPQNTTNLDLNLEPVAPPPQDDQSEIISLEEWLLLSMREVVSQRHSVQELPPVRRRNHLSMEGRNDADEQPREIIKTNKNTDKSIKKDVIGNKDIEKSNEVEGGFFDCNICLDLASDPVVTCCGHLFCWPCLYRWLFVHSNSKECPICKGEVTMKTITPIYTRGNQTHAPSVLDASVKIPSRPHANRIESWRQTIQRHTLNLPIFEMIRRLENHQNLSQEMQSNSSNTFLNRIFTSRGMRRGRDTVEPTTPEAHVDSTNMPSLVSAISSADDFIGSYFGNQEQVSDVDSGNSRSRRRRLQ